MFEIPFRRLSIAFDFSFFASVSLLVLLGSGYAVMGLAACLLHELGHLAVMKMCGIPVKRVLFYGAGIKIMPDKEFCFTDFSSEFTVLIAGSAANFLIAAVSGIPDSFGMRLFSVINILIGVFNLLPLQYLDGGKLLLAVIRRICSFSTACLLERFLKWANVFLILSVMIAFAFAGRGNFTLYITLCYLLASAALC